MSVVGWFRELGRDIGGLFLWIAATVAVFLIAGGIVTELGGPPMLAGVVGIVFGLWLPSKVFLHPIARFQRMINDEVERVERRQE